MDEIVRIQVYVLLHEYDTLREEVMRRYDAQFRTIGIFAAMLIGLVAAVVSGSNPYLLAFLLVISAFTFLGLFRGFLEI